jgi:hypothetical protein
MFEKESLRSCGHGPVKEKENIYKGKAGLAAR